MWFRVTEHIYKWTCATPTKHRKIDDNKMRVLVFAVDKHITNIYLGVGGAVGVRVWYWKKTFVIETATQSALPSSDTVN